jgi:hypothetical protein
MAVSVLLLLTFVIATISLGIGVAGYVEAQKKTTLPPDPTPIPSASETGDYCVCDDFLARTATIEQSLTLPNGYEAQSRFGAVFNVCPTGGEYATIYEAVEAAKMAGHNDTDPATVNVCPGTYNETQSIVLTDGISLSREYGAVRVSLNNAIVFNGNGGSSGIENMFLVSSTGDSVVRTTVPVFVFTLAHCTFIKDANTATAAVENMSDGGITVEHCNFICLSFSPFGGFPAINVDTGTFTILGCQFFCGETLRMGLITDNPYQNVFSDNSVATVSDETINTNSTGMDQTANVKIRIDHNSFFYIAGGLTTNFMRFDGGEITLSNNNFLVRNGGGGILAYRSLGAPSGGGYPKAVPDTFMNVGSNSFSNTDITDASVNQINTTNMSGLVDGDKSAVQDFPGSGTIDWYPGDIYIRIIGNQVGSTYTLPPANLSINSVIHVGSQSLTGPNTIAVGAAGDFILNETGVGFNMYPLSAGATSFILKNIHETTPNTWQLFL